MTDHIRRSGRKRLDDRLIQILIQHQDNRHVLFRAALSQELTRRDAVHHARLLREQSHSQFKILDQHLDRIEVGGHQDRIEVRLLQFVHPPQIVFRIGDNDDLLQQRLRLTRDNRPSDGLRGAFR